MEAKAKIVKVEFYKDKTHPRKHLQYAKVTLSDGREQSVIVTRGNYGASKGVWTASMGARSRTGVSRDDAVANLFA